MAMREMNETRALATVRLSFNASYTTEEEVDRAVEVFKRVLREG